MPRSNVFSVEPLIQLMKEVIEKEEDCGILQANLIPMDYLLHYIITVLDELPEAARETLKVWLQLLHNCLTQAKSLLHRSNSWQQRCLDCLSNNQQRASKQVKNWKVHFDYLFQALETDISVFVRGRQAVIAPVMAPIIPLMKDVIEEEEKRQVLKTDLRPLDNILLDISAVFQDQDKAAPEPLKIWLQLLDNSLTDASSILQRSGPSQQQRQRRFHCLMHKLGRPPKHQVKERKVFFNYLFQGLQTEFSMFATAYHNVRSLQSFQESEDEDEEQDEGEEEDEDEEQDEGEEEDEDEEQKIVNVRSLQSFQGSEDEDEDEEQDEGEDEEEDQDEDEEEEEDEDEEQKIVNRNPNPAMTAKKSVQHLSQDKAWTLFRRIAFKDDLVPTDIEECAQNIVKECKGFRLAITLVAAAMRGKTRVDDWKTSFTSIKNAGSSSHPDTPHPDTLHPLLRWSYDALPNSDVKNCFLYSAMYPKYEEIKVQELVLMWIAEGFVRSKQENYLMDMAIGLSYVNLLVDRCFLFQYPDDEMENRGMPEHHIIRVHHVVRKMAIYIGEAEENCLFKADQQLQNFPGIQNEDCKRISISTDDITDLPTELQCPKVVSLMLSIDDSIEEIPAGFVVSLTSLKVLHLHGSTIKSIPSSVGQLKQLEFLSLRGLRNIQDLPDEICHLSSLQFLDLQQCYNLQSLPSRLGELKNLKHLNLSGCERIDAMPHEISQLTSLSTLNAWRSVTLSVEAESEASIWRLKGLRNLTMLSISVTRIEEGIMGTWLDMRQLELRFDPAAKVVDLPQDMKNMSKLQLFLLERYQGSSLPEYICNFQHLESISLCCEQLRELSPLERVPNLKALELTDCHGLKELGIGNSGGFLMLEKLVLDYLQNLESIGGASNNNGVWNESALPRLRILIIKDCPKLRLPVGMDKLPNLKIRVSELRSRRLKELREYSAQNRRLSKVEESSSGDGQANQFEHDIR